MAKEVRWIGGRLTEVERWVEFVKLGVDVLPQVTCVMCMASQGHTSDCRLLWALLRCMSWRYFGAGFPSPKRPNNLENIKCEDSCGIIERLLPLQQMNLDTKDSF